MTTVEAVMNFSAECLLPFLLNAIGDMKVVGAFPFFFFQNSKLSESIEHISSLFSLNLVPNFGL